MNSRRIRCRVGADGDGSKPRRDDLRVVVFTAVPGRPSAKALEELSTILR
jgi:hypothetical protein